MKLIFALLAGSLAAFAADVTGTWVGGFTPDGDTEKRPAWMSLKQEGTKITGSAGPDASERYDIEQGKVSEDGVVTFVVRTNNAAMKVTLKQEGDVMKGAFEREHNGEQQRASMELRREKQ